MSSAEAQLVVESLRRQATLPSKRPNSQQRHLCLLATKHCTRQGLPSGLPKESHPFVPRPVGEATARRERQLGAEPTAN